MCGVGEGGPNGQREIESEKRNTDSEEGRHRERGGDTEEKARETKKTKNVINKI